MIKGVWLAMRGQKMNFKNDIRICVHMCIYLYMCGSNESTYTQSDNYIMRLILF